MIKRSYRWYLILLNYSIILIRHDNYDICITNTLNNYEQGKCRLRLKLFCNFILSERIIKVYIYNITASCFLCRILSYCLFYVCFLCIEYTLEIRAGQKLAIFYCVNFAK